MGLESTANGKVPKQTAKILIKGQRTTAFDMKVSDVATKFTKLGFYAEPSAYGQTEAPMKQMIHGQPAMPSVIHGQPGMPFLGTPDPTMVTPYDFGGRSIIRPLFDYYTAGVDAVVFLVNCTEKHLLPTMGQQMAHLSMQYTKENPVICIIAENYDLPGAASIQEVVLPFQMTNVTSSLFFVSSSKEGLDKAMNWLTGQLQSRLTKRWMSNLSENSSPMIPIQTPFQRLQFPTVPFPQLPLAMSVQTSRLPEPMEVDSLTAESQSQNWMPGLNRDAPKTTHSYNLPSKTPVIPTKDPKMGWSKVPQKTASDLMFGDLLTVFRESVNSRYVK